MTPTEHLRSVIQVESYEPGATKAIATRTRVVNRIQTWNSITSELGCITQAVDVFWEEIRLAI